MIVIVIVFLVFYSPYSLVYFSRAKNNLLSLETAGSYINGSICIPQVASPL